MLRLKNKTGNSNQVKGALFEILGIGYMADKSKVTPTKDNQPGYDAIVQIKQDLELRVSIKNYSLSIHQNNF